MVYKHLLEYPNKHIYYEIIISSHVNERLVVYVEEVYKIRLSCLRGYNSTVNIIYS